MIFQEARFDLRTVLAAGPYSHHLSYLRGLRSTGFEANNKASSINSAASSKEKERPVILNDPQLIGGP